MLYYNFKKLVINAFNYGFNITKTTEKTKVNKTLINISYKDKQIEISDNIFNKIKFKILIEKKLTKKDAAQQIEIKVLQNKDRLNDKELLFYTCFWFNINEKFFLMAEGNRINNKVMNMKKFLQEEDEFLKLVKTMKKSSNKKKTKNQQAKKIKNQKLKKRETFLTKEKADALKFTNILEKQLRDIENWFIYPAFIYKRKKIMLDI